MKSPVSRPRAAKSEVAAKHFQSLLSLETDCWDVHHAISNDNQDFVLLDVRAASLFSEGHLPEAVNFPHHRIKPETLAEYPIDTLFVVYCAGPHCNGADKAGLKLALLERPVKKMIGGVTGWLDEGFTLIEA
jgi:rhodanese-related sulfurtransferase